MVLFSISALEKPIREKITLAAIRIRVIGVSEKFIQYVFFKTKENKVCKPGGQAIKGSLNFNWTSLVRFLKNLTTKPLYEIIEELGNPFPGIKFSKL